MSKQIRAMMIGAHPDDCDFRCGGLALKYADAGHKVKFLAMCDGSGGHHILSPAEIAARRKAETQEIARYAGIEYDVWDVTDCELMADLETRKRLVRDIRRFNPDIVFCSRPNDYHADHRNASLLVQDASYLLTVPHFCPDVPAMRKMPVILYFYDHFQNPPFRADVAVAIDDVIDRKFRMLASVHFLHSDCSATSKIGHNINASKLLYSLVTCFTYLTVIPHVAQTRYCSALSKGIDFLYLFL